jgi:hypothetical protein
LDATTFHLSGWFSMRRTPGFTGTASKVIDHDEAAESTIGRITEKHRPRRGFPFRIAFNGP